MPDPNRPRLLPAERLPLALSHLATALPVWGLVANALLLFGYRESSRSILFQARQALQLQVVFLALATLVFLAQLVFVLLATAGLPAALMQVLITLGWWLLCTAAAGQAALGLWGLGRVLGAQFFVYPVVGEEARRLYREELRGA